MIEPRLPERIDTSLSWINASCNRSQLQALSQSELHSIVSSSFPLAALPTELLDRECQKISRILLRLSPQNPIQLWSDCLQILRTNRGEFDKHFTLAIENDLLITRFLRSIESASNNSSNLKLGITDLMINLMRDSENSMLAKASIDNIVSFFQKVIPFELNSTNFCRTYTVSSNCSWQAEPKLGMAFIYHQGGNLISKIRITEQINPKNQSIEWGLGITSRNTKHGPLSKAHSRAHPGQHFPSAFPILGYRQFSTLIELAKDFGVTAIDPLPNHYALYRVLRRYGAEFDPDHPLCSQHTKEVERIEQALRISEFKTVFERAWALEKGLVFGSQPSEIITWPHPPPRLIVRVPR